jgi:vitamin B12 transporter
MNMQGLIDQGDFADRSGAVGQARVIFHEPRRNCATASQGRERSAMLGDVSTRGLQIAVVACAAVAAGHPDLARADTRAAVTSTMLERTIVTASGRPEVRGLLAATVQLIDAEMIERSQARSVTEILAENAVGFFSEWTPAQTSVNLRGGASDGQGRDFRGQVLVLVNGRRAGTANLSKLSLADVERIEIVRGPASVIYGSQAMGGVINVLLKQGRSSPGGLAAVTGGSWGLAQLQLQFGRAVDAGGIDYYVGLSGGRRGDYHAGSEGDRQINTDWQRFGLTSALGWQLAHDHRLDLTVRSDGTYDSGFRGSSWNYTNREDRTNASLDATYRATFSDRWRFTLHGYLVRDDDDFRWGSPVIRSGNAPAPGTQSDENRRRLRIAGVRLQPVIQILPDNELLLGLDTEHSVLRSTRQRVPVPGGPTTQVPPFDNNHTERVFGLYLEDVQRLLNDRLILRAGLRYSSGRTGVDETPNQPTLLPRSERYDATTYSLGASWAATPRLGVRAGVSTGFRAPTATELAADFTALGGGRVFGNPGLDPERSRQVELGAAWRVGAGALDLAVFNNTISKRIITVARSGAPGTSDYANNPDDVVVRGLELQTQFDAGRLLPNSSWNWTLLASGTWHFDMEDRGAPVTANTRRPQRIHQYQAALGSHIGQQVGVAWPWTVSVTGILRGPMWYDTEENLLIPEAEPRRDYIHRKPAFWIWNFRGEFVPRRDLTVFVAVYNLLDKNQHPIFIALDRQPYLSDPRFSNGGRGNSLPGRELIAGFRWRF